VAAVGGRGPSIPCSRALIASRASFRRGLARSRVVVAGAAPPLGGGGSANWRVAEWAPAQPAIIFFGLREATKTAPADDANDANDAAPPAEDPPRRLFRIAVYTKPGCPLCDNLADRAQALLDRAAFLPGGGPLGQAGVDVSRAVERRDVSAPSAAGDEGGGGRDWARLHAGEVPVLVLLRGGAGAGHEEEEVGLARPPPRVTADKLERHLAAAAREASAAASAAPLDDTQ